MASKIKATPEITEEETIEFVSPMDTFDFEEGTGEGPVGVGLVPPAVDNPVCCPTEEPSAYEIERAEEQAKIKELVSVLETPVPAEIIKTRTGPKGMKLSYISGEGAIRLANKLFGFHRWHTAVSNVNIVEKGGVPFIVWATVEVTALGTTKQDVGTCGIDGRTDLEMAIKGSVTDGMKRALRLFGEHLGNSLYADPAPHADGSAAETFSAPSKPWIPTVAADSEDETEGVGDEIICQFPGCSNNITDWTNDAGTHFTAAELAAKRQAQTGKVLCGRHMGEWRKQNPYKPRG